VRPLRPTPSTFRRVSAWRNWVSDRRSSTRRSGRRGCRTRRRSGTRRCAWRRKRCPRVHGTDPSWIPGMGALSAGKSGGGGAAISVGRGAASQQSDGSIPPRLDRPQAGPDGRGGERAEARSADQPAVRGIRRGAEAVARDGRLGRARGRRAERRRENREPAAFGPPLVLAGKPEDAAQRAERRRWAASSGATGFTWNPPMPPAAAAIGASSMCQW